MKLNDNTVLITGGTSGIGLALAKRFYEAGNKVIIVSRNRDRLKKIQQELPGIDILSGDIANQSTIDELVVFIEQKHPHLNILVNNAAIQYNYELIQETNLVNKIDYEIAVNLTASIKLSGLLLPTLIKNKNAAIVNISSGLAITPKRSAAVYCATKAAIHSFTKSLRYQLESTNINVFEVLPPLVDTPMTEGRGKNKMSTEALVEEFWRGFENNKEEIFIGKSKILKLLSRLAPRLADRIMKGS